MRSMARALLICAMLASAPGLAFGWSPEWEQCKDVNNKEAAERALAACSRILADKSERPNHAMALRNRCAIKYTQGNYDGALTDCTQAINVAISAATPGTFWIRSARR